MRINLGGRMRVSDQQYAEASRQDERPALHITFKHHLRFRSKEKLTAGAHSRRERELTWCYRIAAKHWNVTAPRGDWK